MQTSKLTIQTDEYTSFTFSRLNQEIYVLQKSKIAIYDLNLNFKKVIHPPHIFGDIYRISNFEFDGLNQMFYYTGLYLKYDTFFTFDQETNKFASFKIGENKKAQLLILTSDNAVQAPLHKDYHVHNEFDFFLFKNGKLYQLTNLVDASEDKTACGEYEYIDSLVPTFQPNELAFIASNATWGAHCVKIIRFSSEFEYEFIDSAYFESNGNITNLAFHPDGKIFCFAEYSYYENRETYVTIHQFIRNHKIERIGSFINKLDILRWDKQSSLCFLTDDLISATFHSGIVLFDLASQTELERITIDSNSSYYAAFGILIYLVNSELIVRFFP